MAITISQFTSTDPLKKAVLIVQTGEPDKYLPTGQFYELENANAGTLCKIMDMDGSLKVNALWTDITIAGAITVADKIDKLITFFGEPLSGGGGTVSVESEGVAVVSTATINFEGAGVAVTESPVGVALVTIAGGGGSQNVYLYKSAEIDFYNGGLPQTLPLFTTEAGKGRFIPTRVTLEMTDITGAPDFANFTTPYLSLCDGQSAQSLNNVVISVIQFGSGFDFIPAATLVNIDINPNTLAATVKGIFRVEGYYENDYV